MARRTKKKDSSYQQFSGDSELNREPVVNLGTEGYALAFNHNPDPIVITSLTSGQYIDVNEAWVKESGYSRQEAIGAPLWNWGFGLVPMSGTK